MSEHDETQAFLDSLPELGENDQLCFACHPDVPCFNACCGDLNLSLTPYDVLRLRRALGEDSETFLNTRTDIAAYQDTGFPSVHLRMEEHRQGAPCPFVTSQGCSVYPHRPGACRTYPVGRASRLKDGAVAERFFVIKEPHCRGFEQTTEWTPAAWMTDQGLEPYNISNDRTMMLLAKQKVSGRPVHHRKAGLILLALYQLDRFQQFLKEMKVLERLDMDHDPDAVRTDEEATLAFAHDWLELVLHGENPRVRKLDPDAQPADQRP